MSLYDWQPFTSALINWGESQLRNQFLPPSNYRAILCSGVLTNTSDFTAILATELIEASGYERKLVEFNPYSLASGNLSWTADAINYTATTQSWFFNNIVVIANAHENANKLVESMSVNNEITVPNHGLTLNDKVMFTGTVATGLNTEQIYYAIPTSDDTFKVSLSSGGSEVDITTNTTGGAILRYANGYPFLINTFTEDQWVYNGQPIGRSITVICRLAGSQNV